MVKHYFVKFQNVMKMIVEKNSFTHAVRDLNVSRICLDFGFDDVHPLEMQPSF